MRSDQNFKSCLDAYTDHPRRVPDEELDRGIQELERLRSRPRSCGGWVRPSGGPCFAVTGTSLRGWLSDRLNLSRGAAKEQLKTAQVLEAVPEVKEAMAKGDVSSSSVRVLTAAWESHPEAFEASGSELVKEAVSKPIGDLRRTLDEWRHQQDQDRGQNEAERKRERRRLDIAPGASGMVRGDFDLDPEGGEYLMTAVQAVVDAELKTGGPDFRTPRQRRADALVELPVGTWTPQSVPRWEKSAHTSR